MKKDVVLLVGAGQIGLAITRRIAHGKTVIVGDVKRENADAVAQVLNEAGFEAISTIVDLGSKESILNYMNEALTYGEIVHLVNAAGVSPSQASIKKIIDVDLYGTAVLLEEVGKVIKSGGTGVSISSQSGHRMEALDETINEQFALTPVDQLRDIDILKEENIRDSLHAYQLAKRCNVFRVKAEAVKWGYRNARINSISPGIIVTPLALDEFKGPRGDFYKNMFEKCPAGRPGTADEVAGLAELMLGHQGAFITGSDFLIDGGATASYFYGPLKPE